MMDAKGVRNMQSILVVVNKHNTDIVTSCWFIICYRLVMYGNANIKCIHYNFPLNDLINTYEILSLFHPTPHFLLCLDVV